MSWTWAWFWALYLAILFQLAFFFGWVLLDGLCIKEIASDLHLHSNFGHNGLVTSWDSELDDCGWPTLEHTSLVFFGVLGTAKDHIFLLITRIFLSFLVTFQISCSIPGVLIFRCLQKQSSLICCYIFHRDIPQRWIFIRDIVSPKTSWLGYAQVVSWCTISNATGSHIRRGLVLAIGGPGFAWSTFWVPTSPHPFPILFFCLLPVGGFRAVFDIVTNSSAYKVDCWKPLVLEGNPMFSTL